MSDSSKTANSSTVLNSDKSACGNPESLISLEIANSALCFQTDGREEGMKEPHGYLAVPRCAGRSFPLVGKLNWSSDTNTWQLLVERKNVKIVLSTGDVPNNH